MRLAPALLLLTACTTDLGPDVGQLARPIIGGVDDKDDPSVVMLWDATIGGGGSGFICTGTVVSPHVVLTAAHCVAPAEVGNVTYQVFLGTHFGVQAQSGAEFFVDVQEVHFDPKFRPKLLGASHDVAVVITKTALDRPALPINRYPISQVDVGQPVRFIGYGIDSDPEPAGVDSSGVKRTVESHIFDFDDDFLIFSDPAHTTCHGDSGGPGLMTIYGNTVIATITSFHADGNCVTGVIHQTRADVYGPFADPYIAKFDPTFQQADLYTGPHDFSVPERDASVAPATAPMGGGGCDLARGRGTPATGLALAGLALAVLLLASRRRSQGRD